MSSAFRGERKERGGSDQTGGMSKPAGEKLVFKERRRREREAGTLRNLVFIYLMNITIMDKPFYLMEK